MQIELLDYSHDPLANISIGARTSYDSESKEVLAQREQFVRSLIKMGHLTPVEHTFCYWRVSNVSRSCADQFRTYRHTSFSMESQRYKNMENAKLIHPMSVKKLTDTCFDIEKICKKFYLELIGAGIKKEDARAYLPIGFETNFKFSCNFRELRHILQQRLDPHAQEEIREVCREIAKVVFDKGWGWLIDDFVKEEELGC